MNLIHLAHQKCLQYYQKMANATLPAPPSIAMTTIETVGKTMTPPASNAPLTPRLVHIRIMAAPPLEDIHPGGALHILKSYLTAIAILKTYPRGPVFAQDAMDSYIERFRNRAYVLFPHGIPETIEELNYAQKNFLYEVGPANLLFLLQEIPELHPTIRPEMVTRLEEAIRKDVTVVCTSQETEVVQYAHQTLSQAQATHAFVLTTPLFDLRAPCLTVGMLSEQIDAWKPENVSQASNETNDKKPLFIHIKQMHGAPNDRYESINLPSSLKEAVIQSQFKIIETIRQHPGCPVLGENLYEDEDLQSTQPQHKALANLYFPDGIPSSYEALTPYQKKFLYEFGASALLLCKGEIPALHKTLQKIGSLALLKAAGQSEWREADAERERQAVACARETLSSSACSQQERPAVLVVYGANHDFQTLCNKHDLTHVSIDTRIHADEFVSETKHD